MKGLIKGLRYISQIFVAEAKEPEIQIGAPTDVKHVAHIGWDNNSVTNPSWMNEFKAQPGASGSGGPEGAGAEQPSQPGGGDAAGAGKAEKRRTRGKGSGGGEAKRRDGADGSRRPAKTETAAEGCEGEASGAAAPKQRRRKAKNSSGRSKSSSGGAASSEPSAAGAAED